MQFLNSGVYIAGVTPLPIPNREVKPRRADGTIRVTVWESRSMPDLFFNAPCQKARGFFLLLLNVPSFVRIKRPPNSLISPRSFELTPKHAEQTPEAYNSLGKII